MILLMMFLIQSFADTLIPSTAQAQVDRLIETIWENAYSEEELQQAALETEILLEMLQQPLRLNRAEVDDLMSIPGVTPAMADAIVKYRNEVKPFESLGELLFVKGIGRKTLLEISPFLSVDRSFRGTTRFFMNPRYWLHGLRTEVLSHARMTLQPQDGSLRPDSAGGYLGSPMQLYQRIYTTSNHLSLNITQEKDAGEPLTGLHDVDYRSWHVAMKETGTLAILVAGDFTAKYGQGLLLSPGGTMGKSAVLQRRPGRGDPVIRPWKSAREGGAFRGVAFAAGRILQVSGFFSRRSHTAGMNADSTFRKPIQTGYHRTFSERARKNQLMQTVAGTHIRYRDAVFEAGITGLYAAYGASVTAGTSGPPVFQRKGRTYSAASADIRLRLREWTLYGETGLSDDLHVSGLAGAGYQNNQIRWAVIYRSYAPKEVSLFSGSFAESGSVANERGLYMALQLTSMNGTIWEVTMDQVQFPHARYRNSRPSASWEAGLKLIAEPMSQVTLTANLRFKESGVDVPAKDILGRVVRLPGTRNRWSFRAQLEWISDSGIRLRTRAERVFSTVQEFSEGEEYSEVEASSMTSSDPHKLGLTGIETSGFLLFQDVRWPFWEFLQVDARISFFNAASYDARLYQHENDLLYLMTSTVLFDKGSRFSFLLRADLWTSIQIRIKLATTRYVNRSEIGSGLQRIEGSRKTDAGIQVRFIF